MRQSAVFALVAAVLLLATACQKKTQTFDPGASQQQTGSGAPASGTPGPVEQLPSAEGTEFGEKPVADLGEAAGEAAGEAGTGAMREEDLRKIEAGLLTVYFDYDSHDLRADALRTLEANAAWLLKFPQVSIDVQGHTDERGTTLYNLDLSGRRARAVRDHLVRLGVPAERLQVRPMGEEFPAQAGSNEDAWTKNRRAEFKVIEP